MKRALINGITGKDGSYLAEYLIEKNYEVFGMVRRSSAISFERISHIQDQLNLIQGDLLDHNSLVEALRASEPDPVYSLAAQPFVPTLLESASFGWRVHSHGRDPYTGSDQ